MSKEIVCDRCGKSSRELKGYSKLNSVKAFPFTGIDTVNGSDCILKVDLCDRCMDELHKFVFKED